MAEPTKPVTQDTINEICKAIRDELKDPSILNTFGSQIDNFEALATDIPSIDTALCGGFPKGRIVELYGPQGSGKTTVMLHLVAACQRRNQLVYYIDAENALDPAYARRIGVIPERLMLSQPDWGEEALEVVRVICVKIIEYQQKLGQHIDSLIVVDSIPAMVPKQDYDKVDEKGIHSGGFATARAIMFSQFLPKILRPAAESKACLVFINQERASMAMYGPPTTTPGGSAMGYAASVRIRVHNAGKYMVGGDQKGIKVKLTLIKSKLFSIFDKSAEFVIGENGIDVVADVIGKALEKEIITKAGAWLKWGDLTWNGGAKLDEALRSDKALFTKLAGAVV